jgi:hypothetical protein
MGKVEEYARELSSRRRSEWPAYLGEHSGLPGPRGNIELGQAVADVGDLRLFDELIATGDEYLTFCGVVGLGAVLADGDEGVLPRIHEHAKDARWRVREAVAMALQRLGDADLPRLLDVVRAWANDPDPLVQRAAAAGICEPRLLGSPDAAATALAVCRSATESLAARPRATRKDADVRVLRQGLGYCWSVAVAADPARGLAEFAKIERSGDPDVAWVARENRKKRRLASLLEGL